MTPAVEEAALYVGVGLRILVLGVVVFGIVRAVVKPLLLRHRDRGGRLCAAFPYSVQVRVAALGLGLGLGVLPRVWPDDVVPVWAALCGLAAGSLSVSIHHAVEAALPVGVARILAGPRGVPRDLPPLGHEDGREP